MVRKVVREFSRDRGTDLAAALTYYAVLSGFPALLALVSLLGIFYPGTPSAVDPLRGPVEQLVDAPSVGLTLVIGLVGAIWSASGYVGAFGFAIYVTNSSSYNKTYGALAGVIVFLLWLWLTNLALLFGAEVDAELERGRQLQAGMPAEESLQLPARDTTVSDKNAEEDAEFIERGRQLRRTHGDHDDSAPVPAAH